MEAFVFNIACQMIPYINKNALNLFAISNLSVIIEFDSLKYVGYDLLVLLLDRISFIVLIYIFRLIENHDSNYRSFSNQYHVADMANVLATQLSQKHCSFAVKRIMYYI